MCCKRQTVKERTHNARVAGETLLVNEPLTQRVSPSRPRCPWRRPELSRARRITNLPNKEGDRNPAPLVVYPTLRAPRISAGTYLGHSTIHPSATCIRRQMARSVVKSGTSKRCLVQLLHEIAVAKPLQPSAGQPDDRPHHQHSEDRASLQRRSCASRWFCTSPRTGERVPSFQKRHFHQERSKLF